MRIRNGYNSNVGEFCASHAARRVAEHKRDKSCWCVRKPTPGEPGKETSDAE